MNKTEIDWADSTWNVVTGCLHGCLYCYAKGIARRFAGIIELPFYDDVDPTTYYGYEYDAERGIYDVYRQQERRNKKGEIVKSAYPFGFAPTFHRYKLNEYEKKAGRTIFVVSMGDLFGEWVPDEWIEKVFEACKKAPQHRYLFLTKNPHRYTELAERGILPDGNNYWFGSTVTTQGQPFWWNDYHNSFVSIEPIHGPFDRVENPVKKAGWVILGAENGNRKDKLIPAREWIDNIVNNCRATGTAVFMKDSLRDLMGDDFVQEYPWGEIKG